MTRTPDEALKVCYGQSRNGPRFEPNTCKRQTRLVYGVPSDGSGSAAEAWSRTDHRVGSSHRGVLRWYLGGADGNGHVTIDAGDGFEWSVDIKRPGYWDKVPLGTIPTAWPALRFVGRSLDIDGVQVVTLASAKPSVAAAHQRVLDDWTAHRRVDIHHVSEVEGTDREPYASAAYRLHHGVNELHEQYLRETGEKR